MPNPYNRDPSFCTVTGLMNSPSNIGLLRLPKQARSRLVVEKICLAALSISEENGVDALNTNSIAERAGVDISSLYRFFPNKMAILQYIASNWLAQIRSVWERYETEPELLQLQWEEYFCRISADWQSAHTQDYYSSLRKAWLIYPELEEMDVEHRENYIAFFLRQMKRFGARGTKKEWRDLAVYLYLVEDEIHTHATNNIFSTLGAGRDLFVDSMLFHLREIMPESN